MIDIVERLRITSTITIPSHLASTGLHAGTAQQAIDEILNLRSEIEQLQKDRDIWRKQCIELGLEASQAEALLQAYQEACDHYLNRDVHKGYGMIKKVFTLACPTQALNNAIADELEKMVVDGYSNTILQRAKELRNEAV